MPDIEVLIDAAVGGAAGPDIAIDSGRIGLCGHSFGGWTALAVPDVDARISSIVVHAPAGGKPTPPGTIPCEVDFQWGRPVPTLFVVADEDNSLPLASTQELFARAAEPKRLLVLPKTDHLHFGDDVEKNHDAVREMFTQGPLAGLATRMRASHELMSGAEAQRLVAGLTLAHFDATLLQRGEARTFLDRLQTDAEGKVVTALLI